MVPTWISSSSSEACAAIVRKCANGRRAPHTLTGWKSITLRLCASHRLLFPGWSSSLVGNACRTKRPWQPSLIPLCIAAEDKSSHPKRRPQRRTSQLVVVSRAIVWKTDRVSKSFDALGGAASKFLFHLDRIEEMVLRPKKAHARIRVRAVDHKATSKRKKKRSRRKSNHKNHLNQ